jgi:acyl-ACP thioesterase
MDYNEKLITSVMGFDFRINLKDENNQLVKQGIKYTIQRKEGTITAFKNRVTDKKWFTHFNDGLYNKILDFRKNND